MLSGFPLQSEMDLGVRQTTVLLSYACGV